MSQATSPPPPSPAIHVLVVHGVGGHDHLSNLLRTYQSFRSNVTSPEPPVDREDRIPGWRLVQFEEGATPPVLRLEPRTAPAPGQVGGVCLYEVNYSGFAGVVRRNHRLDLTSLFVGIDLAVCESRLRERAAPVNPVFDADTAALGRALQSISAVLAAGTVPILGLPALLFRDYLGTFIATFTRFFEDVATFVLDKNGEKLISAHFDRTIETIARGMAPGDRFVIAAHSLGSVVAHNHIVRRWTVAGSRMPDTVITFGSPIGMLTWMWLYLDFEDMRFDRPRRDPYFCWEPTGRGAVRRQPLLWLNVLNLADPIATAFPEGALDLSARAPEISASLQGGRIHTRFFGRDAMSAVGSSHTKYFDDKQGFLAILLRAASLAARSPEDVASQRSAEAHWASTGARLQALQHVLLAAAAAAALGYAGVVAWLFTDARVIVFAIPFLWPRMTIAWLAFFQRLLFGGPTKRLPVSLIRSMRWRDPAAFAYRLRDLLARTGDVDPMAAGPGAAGRFGRRVISFLPALGAMLVPVAGAIWLNGTWPSAHAVQDGIWSSKPLMALVLFMLYVGSCAGYELVRSWRRVVRAGI